MANLDPQVYSAIVSRGIPPSELQELTEEELLQAFLEWHGIIGYTYRIMYAIDNIRAFKESQPK